MNKILVILRKEWLELTQQRGLILSMLVLPAFFTIMPLGLVYAMGAAPETGGADPDFAALLQANPALAGLSGREQGQALIGQQLSLLLILLPLILPSIIASYSIVGEKSNRTLEPLLATPITTWQLLVGKGLAALLPSVALTWISGAIFVAGMALLTLSQQVFAAIVRPGWLIVLLLCAPFLAAITIAGMVAISSRVNDPRTAQQYSAIGVVPFMALFLGQLAGLLVLGPALALAAAAALALVAVLATWGVTRLFQRETILTRWK